MMRISYSKLNVANNEPDTISLDSNECLDLSFENEKPEPVKAQKEVFKTIYGVGKNADRARLLA